MPAARHAARVDHQWCMADDLREIDGRVRREHHHHVLRRKALGVSAFDPNRLPASSSDGTNGS